MVHEDEVKTIGWPRNGAGQVAGRVVIFSVGATPYASGFGSAVLLDGIGSALHEAGYAVQFLVANGSGHTWELPPGKRDDIVEVPASDSVSCDWLPQERRFFPDGARFAGPLQALVWTMNPDHVLAYSWSGWSVLRRVRTSARRLLVTVDTEHGVRAARHPFQASLHGLGIRPVVRRLRERSLILRLRDLELTYAREADSVICCAAQHAREFATEGAHVHYVPPPQSRSVEPRPVSVLEPIRICLLGNLKGVQTRHGMRYFVSEIWPRYLASDLVGRLRFVVIGGGSLPPQIQWPSPHPDLVISGFAEDLDVALEEISALLVPIPLELGFRMRILEGFSRSIPVITHASARAGMPQLNSENAFLASTPEGFLKACRQMVEDPAAAECRVQAGRRCFEEVFSLRAVAPVLGDALACRGGHEKPSTEESTGRSRARHLRECR